MRFRGHLMRFRRTAVDRVWMHAFRHFYESALNDHENAFRNITKTVRSKTAI